MNKKGFTLIELLAVIAIMGILLTAAVVSVNSITDKQKEKLYESKIKAIEAAGKVYLQDHPTESYVEVKTLKEQNYIDDIKDPILNQDINAYLALEVKMIGGRKVYTASLANDIGNIAEWYYVIPYPNKKRIYLKKPKDENKNVKIYSKYLIEKDNREYEVYNAFVIFDAFKGNKKIESVEFKNSVQFTDTSYKETNNFSKLFSGCTNLTSVNLGKLNTYPNTMMDLFSGCTNLTEINFGYINTSKVKTMEGMFKDCENLEKVDLNFTNTTSLNNMQWMFQNCSSLENIDLSNFNTENVTNMQEMFSNCTSLKKINLSSFDMRNNINTQRIFNNVGSDNLEIIVNKQDYNITKWKQIIKDAFGEDEICERKCDDNTCTYTCDFS